MIEVSYISLLAPVFLQLIGLSLAVWSDPYIKRRHRHIMLTIVVLIILLITQNMVEYRMEQINDPKGRLYTSIAGYSIRPCILLIFFYIVSDRKRHWAGWAMLVINAAIHLTALYSGICFTITAGNRFKRGPLGYTCHVVSAVMLVELIYLTMKKASEGRKKHVWIPLLNVVLIVGSVIIDGFFEIYNSPLSCLTIAVVSATLFYYIWLHLQFVQEHERDLVASQQIRIMVAQIKPHFLYNALSVIRSICRRDAGKAEEAIGQFADYLRYNMDSLTAGQPISFDKEMEHVRKYLYLQKLRFQDDLTIEYDLQCTDFTVPTLTIQPLVENAVTWGIRKSETGSGTVAIRSRETESAYEVVVEDNGRGFQADEIMGKTGEEPDEEAYSRRDVSADQKDGRSHIGLNNVRERLKRLCGGKLLIESAEGEGTKVTVVFPKTTQNAVYE